MASFQFDSCVAKMYGVNEAVFLQNIYFWISHNSANNKHFHDGRFWTYNTKLAFEKLFPFWTYDQIKTIIRKLIDKKVLISGKFNENSWDQTAWYSLDENFIETLKNGYKVNEIALGNSAQCNVQNYPIDCAELPNRLGNSAQCIIGTDNKHIYKTQIEDALTFLEINSPIEWETFQMKFRKEIGLKDWENFKIKFNCKVVEEKMEWSTKIILARLTRFALNYVENTKKFGNKEIIETPTMRIVGNAF